MRNIYQQLIIITLTMGTASCSMNRMQCASLDSIQINTKEPIPILEDAPSISKKVFLSKYTDLLDRKLSNYLHSGSVPLNSDMRHPFCSKIAHILSPATPPDRKETALLNLKKDWLNQFEEEIESVVRNNPTIPITECGHVVLPMSEAYLRKTEGDPSGFYAIKPQYDECIAISIATKKPINNLTPSRVKQIEVK